MAELIVLLLAAAAVSAIAARWRFAYRDARSVQSYHSTLERLEHIDGGSKGASETHVKVLPGAQLRFPVLPPAGVVRRRPAAARSVAGRSVAGRTVAPPAPARNPSSGVPPSGWQPKVSLPAVGRKLVFVDESVAGAVAGAAAGARAVGAPEVAGRVEADRATAAGRIGAVAPLGGVRHKWTVRPAIRTAAVAAAAALIAVVTTLSIRADGSGGGATLQAAPSGKVAVGHEPKTVTAGPPVTAPAKPVPLAAGSTADSATYQVSSGPIDLSLVAIRRCWVELRTGPSTGTTTGGATFEGILTPGEMKSFPALPGIWMRIGNPAGLNVIVDGTAIPLPPAAIPYQVIVESTAASPD